MYNEKNVKLYEMYLESNKARNFETMTTTYRVYKNRMYHFLNYLKFKENDLLLLDNKFLKNSLYILERYINYCREQGNNNQTINNKLTAISSFYIWCVKREFIEYHPFNHKLDRLKSNKFDKRRESYFLSIEEIIKARILMEHNPKEYDIQSRLLWDLFLDSAARINAIQNLTINQLDMKNGYFKKVREKGGKITDIIFLDNTEKLLEKWLKYREDNNIHSDYLFIVKKNDKYVQMKQNTIRNRIKKIGKLIGYENLYPHTLRKTAINILSNIIDLNFASEYANHDNIKITKEHYIKRKSSEENRQKLLQVKREKGF